ncbi:MAG TPA: YfiR family protein [Chryseosolibacter sp.]
MKKVLILSFVLVSAVASAQTTNYQVHSLFVLNIAKYSEWPTADAEFHIVVFGKSKMYDELTKLTTGKNINGHTIKVSQIENVTDIGNANIVFLADGKSGNLDEIVKATEGKSIMVIAEREGLFKKGAGFSFMLTENNTLRYDINNAALAKRNIKVSKNLANLANSVI